VAKAGIPNRGYLTRNGVPGAIRTTTDRCHGPRLAARAMRQDCPRACFAGHEEQKWRSQHDRRALRPPGLVDTGPAQLGPPSLSTAQPTLARRTEGSPGRRRTLVPLRSSSASETIDETPPFGRRESGRESARLRPPSADRAGACPRRACGGILGRPARDPLTRAALAGPRIPALPHSSAERSP
jgi:hypothetical protein